MSGNEWADGSGSERRALGGRKEGFFVRLSVSPSVVHSQTLYFSQSVSQSVIDIHSLTHSLTHSPTVSCVWGRKEASNVRQPRSHTHTHTHTHTNARCLQSLQSDDDDDE